jgi:hypothetical protein
MPLNTFRQVFLPYGLSKKEDGSWSVFNREYLPLGSTSREIVLEQKGYVFRKDLAPYYNAIFHHYDVSEKSTTGWLYDDGCLPDVNSENWRVYQARLALLAHLSNTDLTKDMQAETKRLIEFLSAHRSLL